MKQSCSEQGTDATSLANGVLLSFFVSTRNFNLKFCKMVARNKSSSIHARLSPAQIRFTENKEKSRGI
jgi:hypothetical protein